MSAEGLRMLSVVREVRRSYPALDLLARSTPLPQSSETCDALQAAAATITFSASSLALVTDELAARFPAWSTQTNGQRGRTRGSAHAAGAAARDALVLLAPSLQRTYLEALGITKEYLNSIGYVFDTPGSAAPAAAAPVAPAQPQQPTTGTCPAITNFDDCVCGWGTAFTKQRRRKSDSPTTTAQQAVLNRLARRCVYANCHKKALRALALQMGRPQSQPTIASSQSTQLMANVRLVEFVLQSIVKLQLHRNFVVEQLARRCDGANIIVVDRAKYEAMVRETQSSFLIHANGIGLSYADLAALRTSQAERRRLMGQNNGVFPSAAKFAEAKKQGRLVAAAQMSTGLGGKTGMFTRPRVVAEVMLYEGNGKLITLTEELASVQIVSRDPAATAHMANYVALIDAHGAHVAIDVDAALSFVASLAHETAAAMRQKLHDARPRVKYDFTGFSNYLTIGPGVLGALGPEVAGAVLHFGARITAHRAMVARPLLQTHHCLRLTSSP